MTNDGTKHRVEGLVDETKGHVKSAVGEVTGDKSLEHEGHVDHLKGKLEHGIGDLKDAAADAAEGVKDVVKDHAPR